MLAYLKGIIRAKEMSGGPVDRLVIDVGGVGFELSVAHSTLMAVGQNGEEVVVHTSLAIRENEWTLFGFAREDERQIFLLLQSVTGIGPKLALALGGTLGVDTLVEAVLTENQKMISQAPGVGAKVAQRIILEIKGKIEDFARSRSMHETLPAAGNKGGVSKNSVFDEVTDILTHYGYTATEIHNAIKQASAEKVSYDSAEELLRFTLKLLGAGALS